MKTKKKLLVILIPMLFLVGMAGVVFYKMYHPQKVQITLDVPEECKVGQLVVFDASKSQMDSIVWDISPKTFNFRIIDGGRKAIFSSEKVEDYTITVAIALNGKVNLVVTKLSVVPVIVIDEVIDEVVVIDKVVEVIDEVVPEVIDAIPDDIRKLINDQIRDLLPVKDEGSTIGPLPLPDIDSWLPPDVEPKQKGRIIKSLNILQNLMNRDKFETKDEMIQAATFSVNRATQEDEIWEPFVLNFAKFLEGSTSEENCIERVKYVLVNLEK